MTDKKNEEIFPHCPNIVSLCLDSYHTERQTGRIYHRYTADPIYFESLIAAISLMDALYDDIRFPYPSTETRSFFTDRKKRRKVVFGGGRAPELTEHRRKDREEMATFDQVTEQRGKDATFIIRVSHRQHSSWQGEVTWIDGKKKEYFRSALELVKMIDEALCNAKE